FATMLETDKSLPTKAIYVGWTDFAHRNIDPAKLGKEDWIIKTEGDNLILTGGRPRGTFYAVYEYLEQELGCRWLDEFAEIVPSKPELKLETMDIKGHPFFWGRMIYTENEFHFNQELCDLFDARNKDTKSPSGLYGFGSILYGSPDGGNAVFYSYSKDWPADHPEYLAMNDKGERVKSTNGAGPGQICLTNPEVRKLVLEKLRSYIVADRETAAKAGSPAPLIYCIAVNDNPLTCQCPTCKAFNKQEVSDSGTLVDFINYLADGVRTEYPDVLIGTLAYIKTLVTPKTVRPRDNVIIRLAQLNIEWGGALTRSEAEQYPDMFRPMTSKINRPCAETLENWAKISKHIGFWDYWITYDFNGADRFVTPYANISCIVSDIGLLSRNHVETVFVECEKPDTSSFFALKRWLGLKLMQNPQQSSDALVKTFMSGYYGPAAEKMSEYLAYMENRIAQVPETRKLSGLLEQDRPYLDLDFFVTSEKLLDEAENLCGADKAALLHVRRERIPVDSGLLGMWKYLLKRLPAGKTMPFDRDVVIKRYETLRLEQIDTFVAKERQESDKKKVEEQLIKFKNLPLTTGKQESEKPPVLKVVKLKENIDGDLSKVDWSQATLIEKWKDLSTGGELPERKVTGRLAHDDRFLYVQLVEETDTSKLKPELSVGDNWEIFFAAKSSKAPYNQLAINLKGEHADYTWQETPADGGKPDAWENAVVAKSEADGKVWKVSLAFPLAKIVPDGIKPGQKLYANFYQSTPLPGKHMAWSPTFGTTFHLPSRMGELSLE
ncbi:MAG: DUF4838 domain-containing protein, partial [Lentisphaerae bacterium]|nr:DUF4838 domain-containing protein [Lentisphaerota bacterium]